MRRDTRQCKDINNVSLVPFAHGHEKNFPLHQFVDQSIIILFVNGAAMLSELEALVILSSIPHLGSIKIRLLIKHFGTALSALHADPAKVSDLPDFGPKIMQHWTQWKNNDSWRKNIESADKQEATIVPYSSQQFPKRLLEIHDHPVLLYIKGDLQKIDHRCIAIIGTRQASIYGMEMAEAISADLARAGFTIVSGLARGIDTAAHKAALRHGRTLAVIGSGLADIYPRENMALSNEILKKGALISEFPMMTPPDRQNFPQRNRIVSGMTLATVLIEAPLKSGAMITMEKAYAYKRKLFALPGRVDNNDFKGNHSLIKNGQAQLIENAQDIINSFDDLFGLSIGPSMAKQQHIMLDGEEKQFWNLLPNVELTIDEIVQLTRLPVMRVNVLLMSLLLKKAIKEFPGRIYKKVGVQADV